MHNHGVLKTATYPSPEVCVQLDQEMMANCSKQDFLLDLGRMYIWYKLQSEQFFAGALAACQFLPPQYNLKCSFTQIFHYLEAFQTKTPLSSSAIYDTTIGKYISKYCTYI
jgi:hypothetical protein